MCALTLLFSRLSEKEFDVQRQGVFIDGQVNNGSLSKLGLNPCPFSLSQALRSQVVQTLDDYLEAFYEDTSRSGNVDPRAAPLPPTFREFVMETCFAKYDKVNVAVVWVCFDAVAPRAGIHAIMLRGRFRFEFRISFGRRCVI